MLGALVLVVATLAGPVSPTEPVRMSAEIGGHRAILEVRDLPAEEASLAIRTAITVLATVEQELSTANPEGEISRLNAAAGQGALAVDGDIGRMLQTVLGFCVWSREAHGPLGGVLYELWESASMPPPPADLEPGVQSARCHNLMLEPQASRAALAAGSRLDLRHFASGYAVDRAMHQMRRMGVTNAWIEYRSVRRALGPGPDGRGWRVTLPLLPGMTEAPDPVWLRDGAMAIVGVHRERFEFGDSSYPGFLDLRSGRPAAGTQGVFVVSELGLDAQAIATTMVVLGNREGQLRLGGVLPSPSVLWLLGDGTGEPLLATYRWSELITH